MGIGGTFFKLLKVLMRNLVKRETIFLKILSIFINYQVDNH